MKSTNKILAGFAVLAVMAVGAGFAVNIKGAIVDATTGYTFGGTAPNNHVLCGNGSEYVDAASCGTVASPNYQTMQNNGTPLTARADLNFDPDFTLSDTSPSTTVALAATISSTAANSLALGGTAASFYCMTSGLHCPVAPPVSGTISDVTGSRSFGSNFTNSGTTAIYVSGFGVTTSGGGTSQMTCIVNGIAAGSWQANATVAGDHSGFSCMVPPGMIYQVDATSTGTTLTLGSWTEFVF